MIPERFMVTGKCFDNGKNITGTLAVNTCGTYFIVTEFDDCASPSIITALGEYVDPETVEPVAVKPFASNDGNAFNCSNCGSYVKGISVHKHMNYCSDCGQRIDWSE